ncbi:MAG: YbaN family protein [Novosphingobium sp.]
MRPGEGLARPLWLAGGIVAFAVGTIGIALPLLPTVPFYLLAAFCFTRSRPEWAERLHQHPRYGPPLRAWRDRRAIGRRAKVSAIMVMALGVALTWFTLGWPWVLIPAAVLALSGTWIATRPE